MVPSIQVVPAGGTSAARALGCPEAVSAPPGSAEANMLWEPTISPPTTARETPTRGSLGLWDLDRRPSPSPSVVGSGVAGSCLSNMDPPRLGAGHVEPATSYVVAAQNDSAQGCARSSLPAAAHASG